LVGKFKDNDGFASYSASFIPSIWKKKKKTPSNIKNGKKKKIKTNRWIGDWWNPFTPLPSPFQLEKPQRIKWVSDWLNFHLGSFIL
jgi:hypothetical protein